MTEYAIVMLDHGARSVGSISPYSFSVALKENTVGALVMKTMDDLWIDQLPRDTMFEVHRKPHSGEWGILGNTRFFLRNATYIHDSNKGRWELSCESALGILARRIVAYKRTTTYADKTALFGNDGTADDLIKAYVRENFGSLATDTDRDLSAHITIDADATLAVAVEKEAAYLNVLSVIFDLANDSANQGTPVYVDIINYGTGFRFLTSVNALGMDRTSGSSAITFSPSLNNITDVKLEVDYSTEANYCYVGGEGQDAARLIEEVEDADGVAKSPYNRIEVFHDARELGVSSVLQGEGRARLESMTPKLRVSGKAVDMPSYRFGKDYDYGDIVNASVRGREFSCHVNSVSIDVTNGQENLDVRLIGEENL